ncbi:MAG: hypothetical protein U9R15_07625 [Chloroflexota bacterium]|nr:hypothetical protein [Chloroflexota bacterium]
MAFRYHETVWSGLYPGKRHSSNCLKPAVLATESVFDFTPAQRRRVAWRLDGGFGSDDNLNWVLSRGYQVLAKGCSHRRAEALARRVERWDAAPWNCWLGWVSTPVQFVHPVETLVMRRRVKGKFRHSYYFGTLHAPSKRAFMQRYNDRGGSETEFRADKSGLHISHRRKHRMNAQEGLVLITDLAHNLLADLEHRALVDTAFAGYGPKRIVRDLLAIPGRLYFEEDELKRIELLSTHQYAVEMLKCLKKYCGE